DADVADLVQILKHFLCHVVYPNSYVVDALQAVSPSVTERLETPWRIFSLVDSATLSLIWHYEASESSCQLPAGQPKNTPAGYCAAGNYQR
ncbi:hypothetical protein, partial [Corynebacterium appendicis]|uniref:hypothetical protein n=1 Tax=Corynebacterium appendicis TaxID=163202 RepID=UPI0023568F58